jgi:hypothetical protein
MSHSATDEMSDGSSREEDKRDGAEHFYPTRWAAVRFVTSDRLRRCVLEDTWIGHGRGLLVSLLQNWRRRYGNWSCVRKQFCRTKS